MPDTVWILFLILFVGVHLLMHRGHGAHGTHRGTRAPGGSHGAHDGTAAVEASTSEREKRHRHGGC